MKAVIDAESEIYTHDILHTDLHPWNILVHGTRQKRRVFIVDFGTACSGGPAIQSKTSKGILMNQSRHCFNGMNQEGLQRLLLYG